MLEIEGQVVRTAAAATASAAAHPQWAGKLVFFGSFTRGSDIASASGGQDARSLACSIAVYANHRAALRSLTCVIQRRDDRALPFALSADLAHRIRDSSFVALDGLDHVPWRGDARVAADAVMGGPGPRVQSRPLETRPAAVLAVGPSAIRTEQ